MKTKQRIKELEQRVAELESIIKQSRQYVPPPIPVYGPTPDPSLPPFEVHTSLCDKWSPEDLEKLNEFVDNLVGDNNGSN